MLIEDDDDLNVYGCLAHWLCLFGQDITHSSVIKHVVNVQEYFCNHEQLAPFEVMEKEDPGF